MQDNIVGSIETIINNIPNNLEEIEMVRWLYVNLGNLFSYDLTFIANKEVLFLDVDYERGKTEYLSRFQTCKQISQVLVNILSSDPFNIKANMVEKRVSINNTTAVHYAVGIELTNGEKYLLDLTMDLFLIQSGCQTKDFGFSTNAYNEYDIIPLSVLKRIDEKIGFINEDGYFDEKVNNLASCTETSKRPVLLQEILSKKFHGKHEALMFSHHVFEKSLTTEENAKLYYFNLYYKKEDMFQFITVYIIGKNFEEMYIYDLELGFVKTNVDNINKMLEDGFVPTNRKNMNKYFKMLENNNLKNIENVAMGK